MTNTSSPVFSPVLAQRVLAEASAFAVADFSDSPAAFVEALIGNFEAFMWDVAHEVGVEGTPECFRGALARFRDSLAQGVA